MYLCVKGNVSNWSTSTIGTTGKIILLQHFNICSFTLWMPSLLWIPGAVAQFASPLYAPLGTVYGGLLSESLIHVWASQAMLTMYEIEKSTKRIMTT